MDLSNRVEEIKAESEHELLTTIYSMVKKEQNEDGKSFNEACGYVLSEFFEHRDIANNQ